MTQLTLKVKKKSSGWPGPEVQPDVALNQIRGKFPEMPVTVFNVKNGKPFPAKEHGQWNAIGFDRKAAGIVTLDLDCHKEGQDGAEYLDNKGLLPDPDECVVSRTPRNGTHYIFKKPPDSDLHNSDLFDPGAGVELKASNPEILWGAGYHLTNPPNGRGFPPLPENLLSLVKSKKSISIPAAAAAVIGEGNRTNTLFSLAGAMRRKGASEGIIIAALEEANKQCNPPLPHDEIVRHAKGATKFDPHVEIRTTEAAAGEAFAGLHGDSIRFDHALGAWFIWDGSRWAIDKKESILGMVKAVADEYRALSDDTKRTTQERSDLFQFALSLENRHHASNALFYARSDSRIAVAGNPWDADPFRVNLRNGTFDLRDCTLRPHAPEDQITRCMAASYSEGEGCPAWQRFLKRILPNAAMRAFLQRWVGYCLSGLTDAQYFVFFYGHGANGKSVLISLLENLFGDYFARIRSETVMRDGKQDDLLHLHGARLVTCSEIDKGHALAESLIKDLTGGESVIARPLYRHSITFKPSHKLLLFGNHQPAIRGADHAIWRRVVMIPFEVQIPGREQRPAAELLAEFREESAGILAWCIEGWREFRRSGMGIPKKVHEAVAAYREQEDVVQRFLHEAGARIEGKFSALYNQFHKWSAQQNEVELSRKAFSAALKERGVETIRKADGVYIRGVYMKAVQ
jgi:putative DNA primase/helicase